MRLQVRVLPDLSTGFRLCRRPTAGVLGDGGRCHHHRRADCQQLGLLVKPFQVARDGLDCFQVLFDARIVAAMRYVPRLAHARTCSVQQRAEQLACRRQRLFVSVLRRGLVRTHQVGEDCLLSLQV